MASSVLNAPPTFTILSLSTAAATTSKTSRVSFTNNRLPILRSSYSNSFRRKLHSPTRFNKLLTFSTNEETAELQTDEKEADTVLDSEIELNTDGAIDVDSSDESDEAVAEEPNSIIVASLSSYKEAIANGDEEKVAEVESFFKSIEDEKSNLEKKVAALSEELSSERARILRISADFDNFRKRTERERISLVTNARGEVVESLLPVVDNFERAKLQIKIETEGEEKVNNSYQSIYKQFFEILGSLGVVPVETVGKPFDPMLHEAIMREDSSEYEDGVVIEEYRKGFQLGERLLRPSMVKVSAGPGPAKSEPVTQEEDSEAGSTEATAAEATFAEE